MTPQTVFAASEPAGGAATGEIVIATLGAGVVTTLLLVLGLGHRSGRIAILGGLASFSQRLSGLPGWAALPSAVTAASLLTAVLGMYWDIALHIDVGRDEGPLANPAHYFILAGLFGVFSGGFLAMVLPKERPSATAIRITDDWHAPLGGVLICACGAFSLLGFPLDDMWHRIFGQDVTLWGPTHLMLIGGAAMCLVGQAVLLVEASRANAAKGRRRELPWAFWARRVALGGGLLLGLSTFQAEFDFGVPQFRFVFQPILIMVAAGVGLVAIRLWLGRGAALGAVAFFLVVRGGLALIVGPILGETTPLFPLYVAEAILIELVALRIGRDRPLAFGAVCGALIGTVGLAAEWGWSHLVMPLPWPSELLPEAALLGLGAALAGSLVGAWIGARLGAAADPLASSGAASPRGARPHSLRIAAVAGAAAIFAIVGYSLHKPAPEGVSAGVTLEDVRGGESREVEATIALRPADAADGAEWVTVTSWQGGGLVVDRLERIGPGRYRSNEPIPVHGEWKALVRIHRGNTLGALPIYMPEDTAIPAREVPATASFTREVIADHEALQREQKPAAPGVSVIAYLAVMLVALALLALLAWGLHRIGVTAGASPDREPPASRRGEESPRAGSPTPLPA